MTREEIREDHEARAEEYDRRAQALMETVQPIGAA